MEPMELMPSLRATRVAVRLLIGSLFEEGVTLLGCSMGLEPGVGPEAGGLICMEVSCFF